MAEVHVAKIIEAFGLRRLDSLRPSDIRSWMAQLQADHADSYVYAMHARLAQILSDAVHDGVLARSAAIPSHFSPYGLTAALGGLHGADLGTI